MRLLHGFRLRNLAPPQGNVTMFFNRCLRQAGIRDATLLCCVYQGEVIFVVVTDDGQGTSQRYQPFEESERATVQGRSNPLSVGFITVVNPFDDDE
jgi:hypothetical protein